MLPEELATQEYAKKSLNEILNQEWAPCRTACPAHVDVRSYLELAARGFYDDALAVIREQLPFPGACGRICHHPCESACRRKDVDEPAAIRDLKRFIFDHAGDKLDQIKKTEQTRGKVAVIGGGPSGLTAAFDLVQAGYAPTVFEKNSVLGGMLATGVPQYRLPADILKRDVDFVLAHGVKTKTGVEIGRDVTVEQLRKDGFKAIILAVGLSTSRGLPIPGVEHGRVHQTVPFLWAAAMGEKVDLGDNVLVIGGGNVAVDVARTALRLGAKRVNMVCLEDEKEIPAWDWEVRETIEEGISIHHRRGPKAILTDGDSIKGLETTKVTRVFDDEGRFSPEFDESDLSTIDCDTVIFAIGQASELGFLEGTDVTVDDRGRLQYDAETGQTSAADIFATGEVVTGPGSAIEAVASGHRIAKAVKTFIEGGEIDLSEALPAEIGDLPEASIPKIPKTTRPEMPTISAEQRKTNFRPFEMGFDEAKAIAEARRCMSCGAGAEVIADRCCACLTCLRVCPFDVPEVKDTTSMPSTICQACGLCVTECPRNAIFMKGFNIANILGDMKAALAKLNGAALRLLVLSCGHHAPAGPFKQKLPEGVVELHLPTIGRLGVTDMLHAYEYGADGILVLECESGTCRYPSVDVHITKRVDHVKKMLKETGMGEERLMLNLGAAGNPAATEEAVAEALIKLKELGLSPAR